MTPIAGSLVKKTDLNQTDKIAKDPQLIHWRGWFTLDRFMTPNFATN